MDFPIASRKLDDKTPLITVYESWVQMTGHKPWCDTYFEAYLSVPSDKKKAVPMMVKNMTS